MTKNLLDLTDVTVSAKNHFLLPRTSDNDNKIKLMIPVVYLILFVICFVESCQNSIDDSILCYCSKFFMVSSAYEFYLFATFLVVEFAAICYPITECQLRILYLIIPEEQEWRYYATAGPPSKAPPTAKTFIKGETSDGTLGVDATGFGMYIHQALKSMYYFTAITWAPKA
uniref:Uncharacterized protein n=1 Tax=Romanomermis culicivorax TaxID=13658 RepID=A0A915K477_ROMCU